MHMKINFGISFRDKLSPSFYQRTRSADGYFDEPSDWRPGPNTRCGDHHLYALQIPHHSIVKEPPIHGTYSAIDMEAWARLNEYFL